MILRTARDVSMLCYDALYLSYRSLKVKIQQLCSSAIYIVMLD